MSSRRMERVASLLKQAIGRVIVADLSDPRMGFVTVVKVDPSPDLRTAKVFMSVLGEPADVRRTLHGLRHAARFIKHRVADEIRMRSVPDLAFVEDLSVKGAARVSKLIDDAMAQVANPAGEPAAPKNPDDEIDKNPDEDEDDADDAEEETDVVDEGNDDEDEVEEPKP
jgi:ribosome-binding factor A